jgi:hypothetical protein
MHQWSGELLENDHVLAVQEPGQNLGAALAGVYTTQPGFRTAVVTAQYAIGCFADGLSGFGQW